MIPKPITLLVGIPNLAERLERKTMPEPMSGCWLWTGALFQNKYAQINLNGRTWYASRVVWFSEYGLFDENLDVLHKCDNPFCVNPRHLFLGTHADNMRDRDSKNRGVTPRLRGEQSPNAKLCDADIPELFKLRRQGLTYRQIGIKFDISVAAVCDIFKNRHWRHVQIPDSERVLLTDKRSWTAKLTDSQVREVYAMKMSGFTQRQIAATFRVAPTVINGIFKGRQYRHVKVDG